jgi:hypothetical protein
MLQVAVAAVVASEACHSTNSEARHSTNCLYVALFNVAGGSGGSGRISACCQTVLFSPLCAGHDVTLEAYSVVQ